MKQRYSFYPTFPYIKKPHRYCVFLDAGHGGMSKRDDLTIDADDAGSPLWKNIYQTAPAKMHNHLKGEFHHMSWFLEGHFNRQIADALHDMLERNGINCYKVYDGFYDTTLGSRVRKANHLFKTVQKGVFVSIHSNASASHQARGWEVFTSRGETLSDELAGLVWDCVDEELGENVAMRVGESSKDKDLDFYVLRKTIMPAILTENLFFDNTADAMLLMQPEFRQRLVRAHFNAIKHFLNGMTVRNVWG